MNKRNILLALLLFTAVTAIAGGTVLVSGMFGIPLEWLEGSPFHSYTIPGLILMFIVGGSSLIAADSLYYRRAGAPFFETLAGIILAGWIISEILIIRQFSWLQIIYAVIAAAIIGGSAREFGEFLYAHLGQRRESQ